MIGVTYQLKDFFFDRMKVQAQLDKQRLKFLNRAGGFVRKVARNSMRRRKKPSPPGTPPSAHSTDKVATLKNILYGYDPQRESVIVGPVKLNQKMYFNGRLQAGSVPALHEHGGRAGVREKLVGKEWRPVGRRKPRPGQPVRVRTATYPARPFMAPALEKAASKFPALWFSKGAAA